MHFTSIDFAPSYYQIPVHPDSIDKTAIVTSEGYYEFLRNPFGLTNAPSVFQRMMSEIFEPLRFLIIIKYLDDSLIPSSTIEGIVELRYVLKVLQNYGVTVNLSKCQNNLFGT